MHPPDAPPEHAARPAVPRFERIAAGLLVPAYALVWVPMLSSFRSVRQEFFDTVVMGGTIAKELLRHPSLFDGPRWFAIAFCMMYGLIAATIVLAGLGIFRLAGWQGFLRGRSFWRWVVGHGAVGIMSFGGNSVAFWRLYSGGVGVIYEEFLFSAFLIPLCIGCAMLYITRRQPCNL
ncbi:MAG: hypothetical protein ABMA13_11640 [Chthoniobacteraceae bacterium]